MTTTEYVKVSYGYRVIRDGWAVGRLVKSGDLWSVEGNDHREVYAFRDLADAKRATRNLPSRA
jgi:hypothetical protein